jgi:hypothetical protein
MCFIAATHKKCPYTMFIDDRHRVALPNNVFLLCAGAARRYAMAILCKSIRHTGSLPHHSGMLILCYTHCNIFNQLYHYVTMHMADHSQRSQWLVGPRDRAVALLSKQGFVVTELARALLAAVPGQRSGRVQEYAEQFQVSVGTVQAALEYIQERGAARLEARGRLGTFVSELHYPLLWSLALQRPIIGAMPLPYSRRFEGLATGIRSLFVAQPIDLDLRFMRGATRRMQALASQACDWALVSRFAAETASAHGFAVDIIALLGPETYMANHILLLRGPNATSLQDGMRVGVDFQSTDHVYLVRAISRGKQVELVEIEYSQGLRLVSSGAIDATVWSQEDLPVGLDTVRVVPLDLPNETATARLGEGAIVVNQGNQVMTHILNAVLDRDILLRTQRDVVQQIRLPAY